MHPTLPPQSTSFVGRSAEIAEISQLLHECPSRLLTLVGPGGIGKTRLAIQVAAGELDNFRDGVFFVELQSTSQGSFLVSAIANALNISLSESPLEQLFTYLHEQEMLLVLDNFEHLLNDAILLSDLLKHAPQVRLLVTSREVLNLHEEWVFHISGLPLPNPDQASSADSESAAYLFVERARQIRSHFNVEEEWSHIATICRLVEGIPLGLELAATWTRTMSCTQIVHEIERSIDFLVTRLRNVPDRHQSIRAVFEQSWQMLTIPEQTAFRRLSVFRAGFHLEAAEQVAGASLVTISSLVDKSLLRLSSDERYQIHELLRQYAHLYLEQNADEFEDIQARFRHYYANFLHVRQPDMLNERQRKVAMEINTEIDNIRIAWKSMLDHKDVVNLGRSLYVMDEFWQRRGMFREGIEACEMAVAFLKTVPPTNVVIQIIIDILIDLGWFYIRLGRLDEADEVAQEAARLSEQIQSNPSPGLGSNPVTILGLTASIRGHYEHAVTLGQQAFEASQAQGDDHNLSMSNYILCGAWLALGDYEQAKYHAQTAYEAAQRVNRRWFTAYCLIERGNVARAMRDYEAAEQFYRESYDIREAFEDPEGMALSLYYLGKVAFLRCDYEEAIRCYVQSQKLYRNIGDHGGNAGVLEGLGNTYCATGDYEAARGYLLEALDIALNVRLLPRLLSILSCLGELMFHLEHQEKASELFSLVLYHPASGQETREQAQQVVDRNRIRITASKDGDAFAAANTALIQISKIKPPARIIQQDANSCLIDPLTERERDVLTLIAAGLSNREIADELVVTVGTVKAYANHIYSKLGVASRTQAIVRARELQLLG